MKNAAVNERNNFPILTQIAVVMREKLRHAVRPILIKYYGETCYIIHWAMG